MKTMSDFIAEDESIRVENNSTAEEMPNTKITYMYRDGSNYKVGHSVVLAGRFDCNDVAAFLGALSEGSLVPGQVGLKDLQDSFEGCESEWDPELDHPFHKIEEIAATSDAPSETLTAAEFVKKVCDVEWDYEWEPAFIGVMQGRREDRLAREAQESKRSVRP